MDRFRLETLRDTADNYFKIRLHPSLTGGQQQGHYDPHEVSGYQEFKPIIQQNLELTDLPVHTVVGQHPHPQQQQQQQQQPQAHEYYGKVRTD